MGSGSRICIFLSGYGDGGVERTLVNLATGFAEAGASVDFVVNRCDAPFLGDLPPDVHLIPLGTSRPKSILRKLAAYLRATRPDVLLSSKAGSNRLALRARQLAAVRTPILLRFDTNISERLRARRRGYVKRWLTYRATRQTCREADALVAVSKGVAEDLARITGLPMARIRVIGNPVVDRDLTRRAQEPVEHPWFQDKDVPVILGVGGLRRQKDFATLIRAFAEVHKQRSCRLVIFGRGRQHDRLQRLATRLGVRDAVDLPGFISNPIAYMARADLFVLSSAWEGFGNVLAETLAVGTPVVATDCPSGPREILQDGRYGPLVPVGDPSALAQAMADTLDSPLDAAILRGAAAGYTVEESARQYLVICGLVIGEAVTAVGGRGSCKDVACRQ